eukprot:jgi/Undpi1/11304/HiC_scaffold_30.g13602.m1
MQCLAGITGPNGAGKSTLLNAILFGLGENSAQLGARQNAEFASAAHAEVELVFRSVTRGVSDAKLLCSPHALHGTLCEVSGTKAINAHRLNALKQLHRWRGSLADIRANIVALEEAVGREGAHLLQMDRIRELTAELEAVPREMAVLDREIARAELLTAQRLVERLGIDVEALEASKNAVEGRICGLQTEVIETNRGGGGVDGSGGSEALQKELLLILTDLAKASAEVELETASLREKEELNEKWGRVLRVAQTERVGLESKAAALRDRCAALKERRRKLEQDVDRSRAQFSTSGGRALNVRQALDDHKAHVALAEARRLTLSAAVSVAEAEVMERRSQAAVAVSEVDEVSERIRQVGSPLHTAEQAKKSLRDLEDQRRMQRMRQLDLSQTLETSRHFLAAAARAVGAPQWCSQLTKINSHAGNGGGGVGSGGGRGHRGFLFELFELREGAYDHHFRALASLLSSSLGVWVCESSQDADQALDLAKANGAGLRVWPIQRLSAADEARRGQRWQGRWSRVAQAVTWAASRWPGPPKVIDPASLMAWDYGDKGVTTVMEKALGRWVITENDEISALLLSELGVSSLTIAGGEARGEEARLRAKVDWDRSNRVRREGEEALEACALEATAEAARLQERHVFLNQEADECAGRLADSERMAKGARQQLEWANTERERLKAEAALLCEKHGADVDSEGVLTAMRESLAGREKYLETVRAECAQMDTDMGLLAEARMESLERENNAKEVLGVNNTAREAAESEGGEEGDASDPSPSHVDAISTSSAGDGGEEATRARCRLVALRRSVESKVSRVAELGRARDALMLRVDGSNAREKGRGERLVALEEEMTEAKMEATKIGAQLKGKRKSRKEAEDRARRAAAKLEDHGRRNGVGGGGADGEDPLTMAPAVSGCDRNNDAGLSEEELLREKHKLAANEQALSSELRALRRRLGEQKLRGGGASVRAGSVDEVTVRQRQAKVGVLKQQLESVLEGTRQLEKGVVACEGRMREANETCYASVREELRTLFGALCRNKTADLVMVGTKLEDGLRLVVRNVNVSATAHLPSTSDDVSAASAAAERSPKELSGGQQALLGLALVLALSSYQAPPLCLLDEVDAALDEANQAAAARLVAMAFQDGQALCVSHHGNFHRQGSHAVAVEMRDGVSRVQA